MEEGDAEPADAAPESNRVTHEIGGPSDVTAVLGLFDRRYRDLTGEGEPYAAIDPGIAALEPKRAKFQQLDPSHIMQVGMGFWPSKTLLSAVELELFTQPRRRAMTGEEIGEQLGLHPRGIYDFLDTLVALQFLERDGEGSEGRYRNTAETAAFLDKGSPAYMGGILEMANARLYPFWGDLTDALQTGEPQNEIKHTGKPMFDELYSDPARLEQFMAAMQGVSLGNFQALAREVRLLQIRDDVRRRGRDRSCSARRSRRATRIFNARATTSRSSCRSPRGPSPPPGCRTA